MAEQENKLQLTATMLAQCTKPGQVMELPAVRDRWVNTYKMTTGKEDGELKFEAEKVLFMQTVSESAGLAKCTPITIYSSFILLAVSGLSLRDDQCYLIPYKDKCGFMVGWKGRLEQLTQIPGIKHVNEPICVFDGEDFDYSIVEGEIKVAHHKPLLNTVGRDILAVYCTIEFQIGKKTYLMKREEVLAIRDKYSQSYKDWAKIKPDASGKRIKSGQYKDGNKYSFEIEEPMWVSDEKQAFKKTLIKRIYNSISKSASQKYLDKEIAEFQKTVEDTEVQHIDEDEFAANIKNVTAVDTPFEEIPEAAIEAEFDKVVKEVVAPPIVAQPAIPKAPPTPKANKAPEVVHTPQVITDEDETF